MKRLLVWTVLLLTWPLGSSVRSGAAVIPLKLPSGKVLSAEVMATSDDRALGLMFRPALPADRGLLFVFETLDFYSFWMKNCRFPIDMIWLDETRRVVYIRENVPPCRKDPCPSYPSMRKALYVLEINAFQSRREGIALGATLDFSLPR